MKLGRYRDAMKVALVCLAVLLVVAAARPGEPENAPVRRIQTIPLAGPAGRLDHLALDPVHHRLFVANMPNNSLDVVDLQQGKLLRQVPGQRGIQGIAYAADLDVIFVGLFLYKALYLTAALYALFTLIAVQGWREWRRDPALLSA